MTLRGSLAVFGVWTILAWTVFVFIVTGVEPSGGGVLAEFFFFASLLLAATGTMTILGVIGRSKTSDALPSRHLMPAFRQGLLIGLAIDSVLLLQRFDFLRWWNVLLLGGILVLIDLVFASTKRVV